MDLENFISEFFANPENIDFEKYQQIGKNKKEEDKKKRLLEKKRSHNFKHHKAFSKIKKEIIYKIITIGIDFLIALSPLLIINMNFQGLSSMWYFTIIFLCGCSCIDPFLTLIFSGHKISKLRK